jgi:glucokinase
MTDKGWSVGVDLGATKTVVGLIDSSSKLVKHSLIPTEVEKGHEYIISQIITHIKEFKQDGITAIGIAVAGQIDPHTGTVIFGPNLKWNNVPLKDMMSELKIPVTVVNDVQAATWGEWKYGAGQGTSDMVGIYVGTGLGGGLVLDKKLRRGFTNSAGELGHIVVDFKGPKCTCGNHGCVEAYMSGWALAKRAKEFVASKPWKAKQLLQLVDNKVEAITSKTVGAAYLVQDPAAVKIMDEAIAALTAGTVSIVNVINPQRIIFGGGVIEGLPLIVDKVNENVRKQALKSATAKLEIMKSFLPFASVLGAASLARGE